MPDTPTPSAEDFGGRITQMRAAFDACHAALLKAADNLALAPGMAVSAPARDIMRGHARQAREAGAAALELLEAPAHG